MSDEAAPSEGPALPRCPHCRGDHPPHLLKCPDTDLNLPLEGRILHGKFRFIRRLGTGGMAAVWAAVNTLVERSVAIKIIRAGAGRNEETVARFRTEAKAAGRIGHPNVCGIIDFGLGPVGPYIVMERLRGRSIAALIHDQQRLDPAVAVAVVRQALAGLDAAHKRGIIHRDLKPENLFLHQPEAGPPVVKIMDFGVSKLTDGSGEVQTQHGALLGTPEYMSPEQFKGAAGADARTDIWAMGAILYKALTGETAFAGPSVAGTLLRVTTEEPTPIQTLVRGVPPELRAIVERCLSKDPDRRFGSALELSRALEPFDLESRDALAPLTVPLAEESEAPAGPTAGLTSGSNQDEDAADSETLLPTTVRRAPTNRRRPRRPERRAWLVIGGVTMVGAGLVYMLTRAPTASRPAEDDEIVRTTQPTASGPSVIAPAADASALSHRSSMPPSRATGAGATGGADGTTTGTTVVGPAVALDDPPDSTGSALGTRGSGSPLDTDATGASGSGGERSGTGPGRDGERPEPSPPASTPPAPRRPDGDPPADRIPTSPTADDEPPPTPPGTHRVARYLTPHTQGPTGTHSEAKAYCRELGRRSFAGITTWKLASPIVARKLSSVARRGRYWTTALWKGNAITIAVPSKKQGSRAADRSGARPLCVARWP